MSIATRKRTTSGLGRWYLRSFAGGAALTHGFEITFYVLAALMVVGGILAAAFIESKPPTLHEETVYNGENQVQYENGAAFAQLLYKSFIANLTAGVRGEYHSALGPAAAQ